MMSPSSDGRWMSLRHALATLAYRAAKVARGAPSDFRAFRAGPQSRAAGQILAHMCDLMDWALTQAQGREQWRDSEPRSWEEDTQRFFAAVTAMDEYLAADAPIHTSAERLFQGAVADALTHVGQLALLRRLAGAQVRGENYYEARIHSGRTGIEQSAPVKEFG